MIRFFLTLLVCGALGWFIGAQFSAPWIGLVIGLIAPILYWLVMGILLYLFLSALGRLFMR